MREEACIQVRILADAGVSRGEISQGGGAHITPGRLRARALTSGRTGRTDNLEQCKFRKRTAVNRLWNAVRNWISIRQSQKLEDGVSDARKFAGLASHRLWLVPPFLLQRLQGFASHAYE